MNTQALNLFIVDDKPSMVTELRNYLNNRFGTNLNISTFNTGASVLKKVDGNTSIVILDYGLKGQNGNDVLQSIKNINPKTKVIMLSSHEDIGIAIDSFRNPAFSGTDYVYKGKKSWKKISSLIYNIIAYPLRLMGIEWRMNKYITMFLITFVTMGIVVYFVLKLVSK